MADNIDKRVYGGYDPELRDPQGSAQPEANIVAPTAVPIGQAVAGVSTIPAAQAQLQADQNYVPATKLESLGASVSEWSIAHVAEAINRPRFAAVQGYNNAADLAAVPFQLNKDQEKFLQSTSQEEFAYKLGLLEDQNLAHQAMGDNLLTSMIGGIADPGYFAISVATLGAGRVAQIAGASNAMQRVAAGGATVAGALSLGKVEQEVRPFSDAHIVANAMFFGAAESVLYRAGKIVRADPDAPSARLQQLANEVQTQGAPRAVTPDAEDFVGPVQAFPDNLSRPRIAPQGEGRVPVTYTTGSKRGTEDLAREYDPAISLSRSEQSALNTDGVLSVRSVADIAEHSDGVRLGRTQIDSDAKAVYLPDEDRVFLIRDNIKPTDDVKGILLHEVGVHMNAERVLGTERMGAMLNRLEELAVSGNSRAKTAFESVPKNTPLHLVREEALGYYIERNHRLLGDSIVGKFVHSVKETLRRVGLKGLKLSENDINQLVRKAARAKRAGSFDATFPYVWHGSPTKGINQLDLAYAGSGEGASAFGHGHYLTAEKGTALDYRNKEAIKRGMSPEDGGLYRVKISARENQFLDLDGRVQSATVQAALENLGVRAGVTGKTAYQYLAKKLGSEKAASDALYAEGVAGNKYATGRTRNAGLKNSNYVVFSNDAVDMAARYSKGAGTAPTVAEQVGKNISWSLHKTGSSFSPKAAEIFDKLVDNPLVSGGDSVASQQRAIRADFQTPQFAFEDEVLGVMSERGFGTRKQITNPTEAIAAQRAIESETALELARQNMLSANGQPISLAGLPEHVQRLSTKWNEMMAPVLAELKRSGATGAAQIAEHAGYFPRLWDNVRIEAGQAKLVESGMSEVAARQAMIDSLSIGMQRANGWDAALANDIATATLDRARRKGYFEDSALRRHAGEDTIAEVRDYLTTAGVTGKRLERALNIMAGKADEVGKAPALKHRVQVSLDEPIGNTGMRLVDLLDTSLVTMAERYLDNMSATAAFARKGLTKPSDIGAMRTELLASITSQTERKTAADLFDNTIAALRGDPVGEDMGSALRMSRGLTQMVGLARSGLFQLTEFAPLMAEHGFVSTAKHMVKELPFVRGMLSDPLEAEHLRNVLARNSSADIRMRPFLTKTEDGFAIPHTNAAEMSIMQAKQLVPYLNGLKYIQGYQARVSANLAVNTFERAAKGDIKALAALEQYGLERHIMDGIRGDIAAFGMDTAKWADTTWDAVRGPMTKMMDDAVLRARTGEIPAFAQFSTTGKFIFTFRSFTLAAHNKVMAGTLNRKGFSGLGLILMYQLPMMYAMAQASNTISGKKELTEKEAFWQALGQAGSLGLLSEAVGVISGEKQEFGSPGLIALDRVYRLGSSAAKAVSTGDVGAVGANAYNATPLLSVIPVLKWIPENLKSKE